MSDTQLSGLKPNRDVKYAMNMFKKYDADGSGEIDKTEFRAIAKVRCDSFVYMRHIEYMSVQ